MSKTIHYPHLIKLPDDILKKARQAIANIVDEEVVQELGNMVAERTGISMEQMDQYNPRIFWVDAIWLFLNYKGKFNEIKVFPEEKNIIRAIILGIKA